MTETYPAFEGAAQQFQTFLAGEGWPTDVQWIRPSDARLGRGRVGVRNVPRGVGEQHARNLYSRAVSAGLGVMLEGTCRTSNVTVARVIRPLSEDASVRGLFAHGLKLGVLIDPPAATFVCRWTWVLSAATGRWPEPDPDVET
jgi:hypothetical protein